MLRFHATDQWVLSIRFFPDGQRLAVATGPSIDWTRLSIWNLKAEAELVRHQIPQRVVALSHDLSNMAILDANNLLTIRDPYTFVRRFPSFQVHRRFLAAHFQPESSRLLALAHSNQ